MITPLSSTGRYRFVVMVVLGLALATGCATTSPPGGATPQASVEQEIKVGLEVDIHSLNCPGFYTDNDAVQRRGAADALSSLTTWISSALRNRNGEHWPYILTPGSAPVDIKLHGAWRVICEGEVQTISLSLNFRSRDGSRRAWSQNVGVKRFLPSQAQQGPEELFGDKAVLEGIFNKLAATSRLRPLLASFPPLLDVF